MIRTISFTIAKCSWILNSDLEHLKSEYLSAINGGTQSNVKIAINTKLTKRFRFLCLRRGNNVCRPVFGCKIEGNNFLSNSIPET